METSKTSKAADTAAGADTENAGISRECKYYGSWKIFICFKRMVSFIHYKWIKRNIQNKKTNKHRRGKNHRRTKEISVQQTSWIFCCIQHTLRRQDSSCGSLCGFLKLRQSIISQQLFLRCLCPSASYSSWLLNLGPIAATGCSTRAEKPNRVSQRALEGHGAGGSRGKSITGTGISAVPLARKGLRGGELSCWEWSDRQDHRSTRERTHLISVLDSLQTLGENPVKSVKQLFASPVSAKLSLSKPVSCHL